MKAIIRLIMLTFVVAALGAVAMTASDAFVSVTAPVVETTGENTFGINSTDDVVTVTITARPGWKLDGGETKTITHQFGTKDSIEVYGKNGEESMTIYIEDYENHIHETTNIEEHIKAPEIAAMVGGFKHVNAYTVPDLGVDPPSPTNVVWHLVTNGLHRVRTRNLPCPVRRCKFGRPSSETITYIETYPENVATKLSVSGLIKSPKGPVVQKGFQTVKGVAKSDNDCAKCNCRAITNAPMDVYFAVVVADPYLGLTRTDERRPIFDRREAELCVTPEPTGSAIANWSVRPLCKAEGAADQMEFGYYAEDKDVPSASRNAEWLTADVEVSSADGCSDSVVCTNVFTVVKVNVRIGEESDEEEDEEEKVGALIAYVPDAKEGPVADDWTNLLTEVSLTCYPDDIPEKDVVKVTAPKGYLYVKDDKGKYVEAKRSYSAKVLNATKFYLHGHRPSESFCGDAIEISHPASLASDKACFTVLGRPLLVPDYKCDGVIDDDDVATAEAGEKVFRFWTNADDDDSFFGLGKINKDHGNVKFSDGKNNSVDGYSDLVDFTPIWIKIAGVFPKDMPQSVINSVKWRLRSSCVNAVWSDLKNSEVREFQTTISESYGVNLKSEQYSAKTVSLEEGVELKGPFYDVIVSDKDKGVMFVEGAKPGSDLELVCMLGNRCLASYNLNISISAVEDMYRFIDIRGVVEDDGQGYTRNIPNDPPNRPDAECDEYHYVFVHGYNVNNDDAYGWANEIFKRLWQSGMQSKFSAVDWLGSKWQVLNWNSFNYYVNSQNAFMSAQEFKEVCDLLPGIKVVMGHSLGNMVVSSAIVDFGLKPELYYMLNAAVSAEAYGDFPIDAYLVPSEWSNMVAELPQHTASRWYINFTTAEYSSDFRRTLAWKNRFNEVPMAVNCFSQTEDVVGTNTCVWGYQELFKGTAKANMTTTVKAAGWGRNDGFWGSMVDNFTSVKVKDWLQKDPITTPAFLPFKENGFHDRAVLKPENAFWLQSHLLSYAIPALSRPAACCEMRAVANIDYEQYKTELWPWSDQRWHHSDIRNVAYYYLRGFYDTLVMRDACVAEE